MLDELIAYKLGEEGGNPLAMVVYPARLRRRCGPLGGHAKPLAASAGWTEGKPEVSRNFDDVFPGLALGIKFQGTSVAALGRGWVERRFLILGVLSLLLVGGLVLTYRSVSKEVALARLKSDFVSNVSHELRTPLALIRLYAETLELGRIKGQDKVEEYYRIIRTESERLTALINNILDFSRIEAGTKEYDFRQTDLAELVRNTLDTYRAPNRRARFHVRAEHRLEHPARARGPGGDCALARQPRQQRAEILGYREVPRRKAVSREMAC